MKIVRVLSLQEFVAQSLSCDQRNEPFRLAGHTILQSEQVGKILNECKRLEVAGVSSTPRARTEIAATAPGLDAAEVDQVISAIVAR